MEERAATGEWSFCFNINNVVQVVSCSVSLRQVFAHLNCGITDYYAGAADGGRKTR